MASLTDRALGLTLLRNDLVLAKERAEVLDMPDVTSLIGMTILAMDAEMTGGTVSPLKS